MANFKRAQRVAGQVQGALARELRGIKDPRVTPISITEVRLTEDLRIARVYFMPLGGEGDSGTIQEGLTAAAGWLRRKLGRQLSMKAIPKLEFFPDDRLDEALKVGALIEKVVRQREE